MKVLIMGCGRVGAIVASTLWREGHSVVVLDANAQNLRRLPPELQDQAIVGDGALEEDLRRAGVEEADAFLGTSVRDTANALAAQMAKHVFGVEKVVCHINDPARYEMYRELGLEAVSPTQLVADMILEAVHR